MPRFGYWGCFILSSKVLYQKQRNCRHVGNNHQQHDCASSEMQLIQELGAMKAMADHFSLAVDALLDV
ncbi:hypothetical protein [Leminorella grimontii]|uniref:hypothetical protein n=1 Tax=Leminorella grimontii TaxID=82981 RepID=UPI00207EC091|nr:hypothetical protein [Leminorella grimontii]GKX60013.1 hypothetical protein SOASR031_23280 [Leminorella grimontii]